jgi:exocyst complex component 2
MFLLFRFPLQANVGYSMSSEEQGKESRDQREKLVTEQSDVLLSKLIHRLTIVLVQYLPSFWRLAMGIFNGKFGKVQRPFWLSDFHSYTFIESS